MIAYNNGYIILFMGDCQSYEDAIVNFPKKGKVTKVRSDQNIKDLKYMDDYEKEQENKKSKYFFIVFVILPLLICSCGNADYSVKSNPDFGNLANFEVHKEVGDRYKIQFDKMNSGFLLLNKDTVSIVLNNDKNKTKVPFFIQDNLLESQDTLLLNSTGAQTVIIRRNIGLFSENICSADIIFTSEIEHSLGYRIWFSFDRGIIQVLTKDIVCVEVLTFFPDLKYRMIKKDNNAGYL